MANNTLKVGTIKDPKFDKQWNLKLMNVPDAWNYSIGSDAVVGIIDSGVDGSHADLGWDTLINITASDSDTEKHRKYLPVIEAIRAGTHPKLLPGYNFLDNNDDTWDKFRHGTYLAGTIAAESDEFGMVGVAPNAKIRPYVIVDRNGFTTQDLLAKAIKRAVDDGCDVINISLAWHYIDETLSEAIAEVTKDSNVIIVSATGNDNTNKVCYPGSDPNVICAGGCNPAGKRWVHSSSRGSNYGDEMLCVTPGSEQETTWFMRWRHTDVEGTSQSVANLSGVIALLKAIDKDINREQVVELIKKNSSGYSTGYDKEVGWGVPNASVMAGKLASQSQHNFKEIAKRLAEMSQELSNFASKLEKVSKDTGNT